MAHSFPGLTEVSDLNGLSVTSDNRVDGEMGVDELHLVLETLGDTGDHVGDHGLDGSQTSNVLSVTVPNGESSLETLGGLDLYVGGKEQEQSEIGFRDGTFSERLTGRQS